jgi:hypothetical protein
MDFDIMKNLPSSDPNWPPVVSSPQTRMIYIPANNNVLSQMPVVLFTA